MAVDKEQLLKSRLNEADVDVPGVGTVRVRGLSRAEVLMVQKLQDQGVGEMERHMLSVAMVDPVLTPEEVGEWQQASSAGEMEPVSATVMELSGMTSDATKRAIKEAMADPATAF